MTKKEQIEELYIDALNNDDAPNLFADQILFLFGVVWQSEQLCEGLHSTDFNGKCFKCGEQVFVKEPK